ncbi:LEA type 2 family protein [Marinobacterium sp. AK62]|uniref:LEA type 2 family protein n=1 Tax=Marinobacterium alkalitolerans TaxID=1542925 RepID=A0ABS3Z914_9GAMM|nr:LEA type 2 family protein [Marinobacterium alkalitolerans]MBP0048198.1 LEA type 2 family protein [Marinobacterium alkalitolerans]
MRWTRAGVWIVLLGLLLGGCASLQPGREAPVMDVVGVRLDPNSQGAVPRFLIRLRILNPNRQALVLEGVRYHLYLQEQRVLSGVTRDLPRIPGYAEETVEVGASPALFGSVRLLQEMATTPGLKALDYRVEVKLDSGGLSWPVEVEQTGRLSLSP